MTHNSLFQFHTLAYHLSLYILDYTQDQVSRILKGDIKGKYYTFSRQNFEIINNLGLV